MEKVSNYQIARTVEYILFKSSFYDHNPKELPGEFITKKCSVEEREILKQAKPCHFNGRIK